MLRLTLAVLISLSATPALAQRPSTLDMSCSEAGGLVASRGAVVLSTGRHTFDRFVAHVGYCLHSEIVEPGYAPTADVRRCRIGQVCRNRMRFLRDD